MAHSIIKIAVTADDFDHVAATVDDNLDGNFTVLCFAAGDVTLTARGDGANVLADGLELLAAKVRAAHTEWLRTKAAEQ